MMPKPQLACGPAYGPTMSLIAARQKCSRIATCSFAVRLELDAALLRTARESSV